MKTCTKCGAELTGEPAFCPQCGSPQATLVSEASTSRASGQQLTISKTVFALAMVALALMGLAVAGLVARGPTIVTQTQISYVTQTQFDTYTASLISTSTETQAYTVTTGSFSTLAAPPPAWFSGQYCGYPFNPNLCNEGPPVTITGYLTNSSGCVNLYISTNLDYVVWNLPKTYPDGAYQVYGFVYPNWPQTQPFPPYPFQTTLCVGIPMWSIPPYLQAD